MTASPGGDGWSRELGHRTVTDAAVSTFGCATGDYARMHFDLGFGPESGMGTTIAHGLLSAAWSLGALSLYAPERVARDEPAAALARFEIRFGRMVHIGDRFSLRWREGERALEGDGLASELEVRNQRGERTCQGAVEVVRGALPSPPEPLALEPARPLSGGEPLYADDMLACGPRGESVGRTVTESDVVDFARFTGELRPQYLNAEFARAGRFGARVAPPMWTFCLGFADFLRELLVLDMPAAGFAGHLGDTFECFAPVFVGDTLRTRHAPVGCTPSRSRPGMAIVHFAVQLLNQRDEVVQQGRVAMMIPSRG